MSLLTAEDLGLSLDYQEANARDVRVATTELLAKPWLALGTAKRVINPGQDAPLKTALPLEGYAYRMLRGTADFAERVCVRRKAPT